MVFILYGCTSQTAQRALGRSFSFFLTLSLSISLLFPPAERFVFFNIVFGLFPFSFVFFAAKRNFQCLQLGWRQKLIHGRTVERMRGQVILQCLLLRVVRRQHGPQITLLSVDLFECASPWHPTGSRHALLVVPLSFLSHAHLPRQQAH